MFNFEFDQNKSLSNAEKHGIDFVEAQAIWLDPCLIEVQTSFNGEARSLVVGIIQSKHWSAITTFRAPNIRIISVRRSRKSEVDLYES